MRFKLADDRSATLSGRDGQPTQAISQAWPCKVDLDVRFASTQISAGCVAPIYARSLNGEQGHASPKQATPVMAKARLALEARIERMKRGLETPTILEGMNPKQAGEVYSLCLNMVPEPPKLRARKRKGKLEASEIFNRVINDPVSLSEGTGKFTGPRMMATIKRLLAKSVKGDLSSADTLVEIYSHSLRYGDFYVKLELI